MENGHQGLCSMICGTTIIKKRNPNFAFLGVWQCFWVLPQLGVDGEQFVLPSERGGGTFEPSRFVM